MDPLVISVFEYSHQPSSLWFLICVRFVHNVSPKHMPLMWKCTLQHCLYSRHLHMKNVHTEDSRTSVNKHTDFILHCVWYSIYARVYTTVSKN